MVLALMSLTPMTRAETTAPAAPNESKEQRDQRMKWFREARFGMFIHWGIYAVPAGIHRGRDVGGIGEWIMNRGKIPVADYKAYAPGFTAAKYDPEALAALAKRAGMRYVVITSKHHDGCALFDSAVSDWTVPKATPAKRDVIVPLEKAVRAQGLHFGLYYSQSQDWVHPGGGNVSPKWDPAQEGDYDRYLQNLAVPQVRELMAKFHPDLVWWDTPVNMTPERAALFTKVLEAYPGLIMNNRLGGKVPGDCDTPEQNIPPCGLPGRDFEVCMTMNETWGFKSRDGQWKPYLLLLQNLSDIASKGGNFLLNIGPDAEGSVPRASVERLEAIGRWMDVNGEAIHGTQASPFAKRLSWGRVTRKPRPDGSETLYLHVWNWPKDGKLDVPFAAQPGATATLLANGNPLPVSTAGSDLVITLPATPPDPDISVIALKLAKPIVDNRPTLESPDARGVVRLSALDAGTIGNNLGNMPISGRGDDAFLGPWTDPVWHLEYHFTAPARQQWNVQVEAASDAPATLRVNGSGKMGVTFEVPATGGEWKTFDVGRIDPIHRGSEEIFTVNSERGGRWSPIKIRNVTLRPAS